MIHLLVVFGCKINAFQSLFYHKEYELDENANIEDFLDNLELGRYGDYKDWIEDAYVVSKKIDYNY